MKFIFAVIIFLPLLITACSGGAGSSAGLAGTQWQLTSLNGQDPLTGATFTLGFEDDGTAGGKSGCNSYDGRFNLSGSELTFAELVQTEMACMDPTGIMEQESLYLQTLSQTAGFALDGERLELKNAVGETILTFKKQG